MNNNDLSDLNRVKTAEEYLKEKNITPETKHHNYDYLYHSVFGAIEQAQKDAFKEGQSSPKIKPLEWVEVWERHEDAKTQFGHYVVRPSIDNRVFLMVNPRKIMQPYSTLSEAKAAAQADFEKRVMECLE